MEETKNVRINAANAGGVLHAENNNHALFYNSKYDLGKHLTEMEEKEEYKSSAEEHFTLAKMNISTKSITPPDINQAKLKRTFLFIKSMGVK